MICPERVSDHSVNLSQSRYADPDNLPQGGRCIRKAREGRVVGLTCTPSFVVRLPSTERAGAIRGQNRHASREILCLVVMAYV
jgi:hypothetical protein